MLNDVHPPPLETDRPVNPRAVPPIASGRGRVPTESVLREPERPLDRAHQLDREVGHSAGVDLVYEEPEDRGAAFNTIFSAVVVGIALVSVLIAVAVVIW